MRISKETVTGPDEFAKTGYGGCGLGACECAIERAKERESEHEENIETERVKERKNERY